MMLLMIFLLRFLVVPLNFISLNVVHHAHFALRSFFFLLFLHLLLLLLVHHSDAISMSCVCKKIIERILPQSPSPIHRQPQHTVVRISRLDFLLHRNVFAQFDGRRHRRFVVYFIHSLVKSQIKDRNKYSLAAVSGRLPPGHRTSASFKYQMNLFINYVQSDGYLMLCVCVLCVSGIRCQLPCLLLFIRRCVRTRHSPKLFVVVVVVVALHAM